MRPCLLRIDPAERVPVVAMHSGYRNDLSQVMDVVCKDDGLRVRLLRHRYACRDLGDP